MHEHEDSRPLFRSQSMLAVTLVGSPGAGKTGVLEVTARRLDGDRCGAILTGAGIDADEARLVRAGLASASVTTWPASGVDPADLRRALGELPVSTLEFLFIERLAMGDVTGDVGGTVKVVVFPVTEGEASPRKHPEMFRDADLVLLTKVDLLPHLRRTNVRELLDAIAAVTTDNKVIFFSAESGKGVDEWVAWLVQRRAAALSGAREQAQDRGYPFAHA